VTADWRCKPTCTPTHHRAPSPAPGPSTRDHALEPNAGYDFEVYLGRRVELASAWNASLSVRSRYFVGGSQEASNDYQEISGALTWLDRWTLSGCR